MVDTPTKSSAPEEIKAVLQILRDPHQGGRSIAMRIAKHGILSIKPERRVSGACGCGISLITGHTTVGEPKKVQLIFTKDRTQLDLTMAFHGSHVQRATTAYGTFHLYYKQAPGGFSSLWANNSQYPQSVLAAQAKYEERGWCFAHETSNAKYVVRSLANAPQNGSRLDTFNVPLPLPITLECDRRKELERLAWCQVGGKIEAFRSRSIMTARKASD